MTKMKIICLTISFLWIGVGTFIQISAYPTYNYLGFDYDSFIYTFLYLITLPCNILLFGLLYADKLPNIYIFIIILQSIKVLIYWWIIYKTAIFFQKSGNKPQNSNGS
jgi:hypothetical protein